MVEVVIEPTNLRRDFSDVPPRELAVTQAYRAIRQLRLQPETPRTRALREQLYGFTSSLALKRHREGLRIRDLQPLLENKS